MRRLFLATLCVAILLMTAPAALGVSTHGAAPTGTGTVNVNVLTFDGAPQSDARGQCFVVFNDESYYPGTEAFTAYPSADGFGTITFTDVPAADAVNVRNAHIVVRPLGTPDGDYYKLDKLSWPAEGWSATLQPGHLPLTITRDESLGSAWASWNRVQVLLWTGAAEAPGNIALTYLSTTREAPTLVGDANTIALAPERLAGGWLKFSQDQGLVLPVAGTMVSPGTALDRLSISQADAQRVWMRGFGSGKPGTRTQLRLDNYPAGSANDIFGEPAYPRSGQVKLGAFTTTGGAGQWATITIPKTTVPGYKYWVSAVRTDVPSRNRTEFFLVTSFQTCTLKSSRAAVARGRTVTLSGIVPVAGHRGSTRGTPKTVTIYRTTSSKVAAKGQPSVRGGGTVAGWTKLGSAKTDGLGRYIKRSIKVSRTTWYCVWYGSDAEYSGGWTTPAKVTAR
jgi:hypothetical protein